MAKKTAPTSELPRFTGFDKAGISWFQGLAMAQNREWFHEHRDAYEQLWLTPMKSLIHELTAPLAKIHGRKLGPPKFFRLNRDVRFSKDKSPYKTNTSALVPFEGLGGPMEGPAALYLHLGLEEVVAFGFYALEPDALKRLRARILDEKTGPALQKLVDIATRQGLSLDGMEQLKRAPTGVDPAHPRIALLKFKGLALSRSDIPKKVRFSADLKPWILEQAEAAAPVIKWGLAQNLLG